MSDSDQSATLRHSSPGDETLFRILTQVGLALGVPFERSDIQAGIADSESAEFDWVSSFMASASHASMFVSEVELTSASDAIGFVREGYPVVVARPDGIFVVLQAFSSLQVEASVIGRQTELQTLNRRHINSLLQTDPAPRCFVCKKQLECDSISATHDHHGLGHHHEHPTPLRRFFGLLNLDRRDIGTVVLFAFVAGVLALASPLAIESLVNVVSWGTYLQPLIVLGLMLLTCLGLAGVLNVLQTVVVELIQRRQFVRIVGDLAHRLPRTSQASLIGEYPRELANRVFDIMTIQKATAVLLLDGVSIVLTTVLGLFLLALYSPFLLGFDIVLVISMISITWLLGRGGVRTAIEESITKYRVAHWLQDVIASPSVFKTGGGEPLAVQRATN